MQCSACRAVYSNGLDQCPRCRASKAESSSVSEKILKPPKKESILMANEDAGFGSPLEHSTSMPSTLIEFPGAGRAARPLWRKELSDRVREIQERRAREAALEAQERQIQQTNELLKQEETGSPLGLVPQPDQPALNPLVAAALKRIERAQHNPLPSHTRTGVRGASVAVARVAEERFDLKQDADTLSSYEQLRELKKDTEPIKSEPETKRVHTLSVVQPTLTAAESLPIENTHPTLRGIKSNTARHFDNQVEGTLAPGEVYDDYAPLFNRSVAGLIDLCVVVFASSPFAAIIELTNGNWADEWVLASMGGIILIVMFLYLTTSTSIGGRTWGMSLLSLRAVDVDTGLPPTTKQSVTRAFAYVISLLTFGVGILYALVDAEGRSVHDHISGTTVVRE